MQKHILIAGASAISFVAGAASGFFLAKAKLKGYYEEVASEEIAEARQHFRKKFSAEKEFGSPSEAVEALIEKNDGPEDDLEQGAEEALKEYRGEIQQGAPALKPIERNIFSSNAKPPVAVQFNERDYDERHVEVITEEEYFENPEELATVSLTYFSGDKVLLGGQDQVVDIENSIVSENALQFGNKCSDPKSVYIKNKKSDILFEVIHHEGKYAEIVQGITTVDEEQD